MKRRYILDVKALDEYVLQVDFISGRLMLDMKPYLDKIRFRSLADPQVWNRGVALMSKRKFDTTGTGKLSNTELSQKFGQYQKQARIWMIVGLLGIAGGLISAVAVQDTALKTILVAALFGGGLCCVLFLSSGAQKKMKTLMREQLGGLFQAELEKSFGPDLHTPEMCIDKVFLKTLQLLNGQWEKCEVDNFYEGNHSGIHFSAANVRLDHVYKRGNVRDGLGTWEDMVFKGVVLRCRTHIPASSMVRANVRTEDRFCVSAGKAMSFRWRLRQITVLPLSPAMWI